MTAAEWISLTGVVGSALVGLGGLGLAAWEKYVTRKQMKDERAADFRRMLYAKQLEAQAPVLALVFSCHHQTQSAIAAASDPAKYRGLADDVHSAATTRLLEATQVFFQYSAILPEKVLRALADFSLVCLAACNDAKDSPDKAALAQHAKHVQIAYNLAINSFRTEYGTEALSSQVLSLIADQGQQQAAAG